MCYDGRYLESHIMASNSERREFEKYLKFLVNKLVQVVVQSRQGQRLTTKSVPSGNEWFNVTISDDKRVSSELKRSLEGRLPQPEQPVTLEIQMETLEGDTLVLEMWSISVDVSHRDVGVSVSHVVYPRLSLMLKSVIALSRTTPTYRLSRQQEDELKFTYRVYVGNPEVANFEEDFKHVRFAETSCAYGTIELTLHYRPTITLPDKSVEGSVVAAESFPLPPSLSPPSQDTDIPSSGGWSSGQVTICPPFVSSTAPHSKIPPQPISGAAPFAGIIPTDPLTYRQESDSNSINNNGDDPASDSNGGGHVTLPVECREKHGYVLVDLQHINPPFAEGSSSDTVTQFLQQCKEVPNLDMFSGEHSMNLDAAMALVDGKIQASSLS